MRSRKGVTLIELMVALATVAILATVAMPSYVDYLRRAKLVEATSTLADMRVKLEQYFQDNYRYSGACAAGTVAALPREGKYFEFDCTVDATTFRVTATGSASEGLDGFVFSIDHNNVRATIIEPGGAAAAAGYQSHANCWVTRKGANAC
jgi:type IV pilus assembly protein PilE